MGVHWAADCATQWFNILRSIDYNLLECTFTPNQWNGIEIYIFSIYTLSDLGDLSNLIGALSRTIQQYSPPYSEWIMCEVAFFPFS